MGRAEERRARQRGGHRASPRPRRSPGPAGRGRARPGGSGRTGTRALFTWKRVLGTFLGLCLLGIGGFVLLYLLVPVPEGNAAAKLQSNVYKYGDGTVLARDGEVNREVVDLAEVPKDVQRTFVAAENKTFYQDSGVDLKGTARGLVNTLSGKGAQGGSTITQQYVKNYYLSQEQTVTRKLRELVISLKVDRRMSKDDILAGYINTSYYGRNAYGIQAAAQAYYRVDADELTVEQGAYLAALLQAPSQYDWAVASPTSKELARNRWNYVLDNMVEEGWLAASERRGMTFPVPKAPQGTPGMGGQTGYLVDAANAELARQLVAQGAAESQDDALAMVEHGGWTLTLNIDRKKQKQLEEAAEEQLTGKLDPERRTVDGNVQPGAVSVDPGTGKVVAMYGGADYLEHYRNNATRRDYQPASTFKPVILAAALEEGAETQDGEPITAETLYDGDSRHQVMDDGRKAGFAPPNEDEVDYGDVTVQTAMNKSVNAVFAQMGVDVGMDEVMRVAGELGMDTDGMQAVPAQTLGSMGASPLEMAGIYATLDNHGKKVTPAVLASAEHKDTVVELPDPVGGQVISREAADTVTSVLTGVVDDGTARASVRDNPARQGQQVAGKTGTSDFGRSAWFTGYTPDLVTSVGLFGEDAETGRQVSMAGATGTLPGKGRVNGGGFPAQIWAAYTFGVMDEVSAFDLETTQGAAVRPTYTPPPVEEPTTEAPTSQPPTSSAPPASPSPAGTPSRTPSRTPTQTPSPTPTAQPPTSTPTDGTSPDPSSFPDGDE
ncbi:transglycosylase domain-containing protein [Streptomyces cinereospinus]|uniref:Transglycosylase domain-containing protein n=1 Tax=Streptomyces cinereospinus TaxID=285561 RepID=A0ABV5N1W6_9ACTN